MTRHDPILSESVITWGVAGRALPGQNVSGDLHLVCAVDHGWLLAVVDGLGHGAEAAAVSRLAFEVLAYHAEEPLGMLVHRCHKALYRSRGAVMTLARIDPRAGSLTWLGVGNVEAVLLHAEAPHGASAERALLRAGLVGFQLPELRPSQTRISSGDLLLLATDGIGAGFAEGLRVSDPPQAVADSVLRRCSRSTDDALVLAASFGGGAP